MGQVISYFPQSGMSLTSVRYCMVFVDVDLRKGISLTGYSDLCTFVIVPIDCVRQLSPLLIIAFKLYHFLNLL